MKKKFIILLGVSLTLVPFSACGGEDITTSGDSLTTITQEQEDLTTSEIDGETTSNTEGETTVNLEETSKETTTSTPTQAPTNAPTQAPTSPPANTQGSFSAADIACTVKGVSIKPDTLWSAYSSALGAPSSTQEAPSCHYDGMDTIYNYSGFSVYTYMKNGTAYVYDIEITSSSIKTSKGITVGSDVEAVLAAYGDNHAVKTNSLIEYKSGNKSLIFSISGGKVSMIEFYSE